MATVRIQLVEYIAKYNNTNVLRWHMCVCHVHTPTIHTRSQFLSVMCAAGAFPTQLRFTDAHTRIDLVVRLKNRYTRFQVNNNNTHRKRPQCRAHAHRISDTTGHHLWPPDPDWDAP